MDMMTVSLLCLSVMITIAIGYVVFKFFWTDNNIELKIAKLFDHGDFHSVIELTKDQKNSIHSLTLLLYAARARARMDQHEEALLWFEKAILKVPLKNINDKVFIELEIADLYTKLKDYKTADIHYRTAIALKKDHEMANYKLAALHFKKQQFESCRNILRTLLQKNPKLADARKLYAECLSELKLYPKAIRQYGLLIRAGEKIVSFNYAKSLKALKIWERGLEVYQTLINNTNPSDGHFEEMICDLAEICVSLRQYPKGLGIIEKYLPNIISLDMRIRLKYIRANLFYQRGDKIMALYEYQLLYNQRPSYKDLKSIINNYGFYLSYPFLVNYFTSNDSLFEQVISYLAGFDSEILRRTPEYYLVKNHNIVHVFYRNIHHMPGRMHFELDLLIGQINIDLDFLYVWTIAGIEGHHPLTGSNYRFVVRTGDDFILNIKEASTELGLNQSIDPGTFVTGLKDVPELIPITDENSIDELLKNQGISNILEDDILNRAFGE